MRLLRFTIALAATALLAVVLLGYGAPFFYELDLLAHFRMHLLGASAIVAVTGALLGSRAALWRSLAAAVLAAAGLTPLLEGPGTAGEGQPVTVMTANVYGPNPQPEAMRRALLAADADILLTVETLREAVNGPSGLPERYPHVAAFRDTDAPDMRVVLWSRFPIRRDEAVFGEQGLASGVGAVVEVAPGRELSVLGVHLSHVSLGAQGLEIERMDDLSEDLPRPLVIMGDFNATAWSWGIRRAEELTGTRRVGGIYRTWNGEYPVPFLPVREPFGLPIDHILVSPGLGVESIETVDIPGSDHDAVRAVLRLPD